MATLLVFVIGLAVGAAFGLLLGCLAVMASDKGRPTPLYPSSLNTGSASKSSSVSSTQPPSDKH